MRAGNGDDGKVLFAQEQVQQLRLWGGALEDDEEHPMEQPGTLGKDLRLRRLKLVIEEVVQFQHLRGTNTRTPQDEPCAGSDFALAPAKLFERARRASAKPSKTALEGLLVKPTDGLITQLRAKP